MLLSALWTPNLRKGAMSILKFYTDTHIDKQVAVQLRQKGVDVVRCEELGMAEADDVEHLAYASEHELSLLTKDADFRDLYFEWLAAERKHFGIFFCSERQTASIGKLVNSCFEYYELVESGAGKIEDICNQFFEVC
jgi:predicted nuclease of predicted toxin-antitoxin system